MSTYSWDRISEKEFYKNKNEKEFFFSKFENKEKNKNILQIENHRTQLYNVSLTKDDIFRKKTQ